MMTEILIKPGTKFGGKTVLRELPPRRGKNRTHRAFLVRCRCGNETSIGLMQLTYRPREHCQKCKPSNSWWGDLNK